MADIFDMLSELKAKAGSAVASATDFVNTLGPLEGADLWVIPSPDVPIPFPFPISCQFNPEQLEFERRARWKQRHTAHRDNARPIYSGGTPQELELDLFYDTTATGADVRMYTRAISSLTNRLPLINQPPLVMFQWGLLMSPPSYVEKVTTKYTFFSPSGVPLRAEVRMRMVEYDLGFLSMLPLNPTTRSEARKTWVVVEGQSLDWIAHREYGDPGAWRHIAAVNNIQNPMDLTPGTILKLTPIT